MCGASMLRAAAAARQRGGWAGALRGSMAKPIGLPVRRRLRAPNLLLVMLLQSGGGPTGLLQRRRSQIHHLFICRSGQLRCGQRLRFEASQFRSCCCGGGGGGSLLGMISLRFRGRS